MSRNRIKLLVMANNLLLTIIIFLYSSVVVFVHQVKETQILF